MTGWPEFFTAMAGATAALSGTLLVAMSINVARIVSQPTLPSRAANTLIIVAAALIISAVALMPVGRNAVGWAAMILGTTLLISAVHTVRIVSKNRAATSGVTTLISMTGPVLAPLPYVTGGIIFITQGSVSATIIAVGVLLSVVVSLQNSWILLIEIRR